MPLSSPPLNPGGDAPLAINPGGGGDLGLNLGGGIDVGLLLTLGETATLRPSSIVDVSEETG